MKQLAPWFLVLAIACSGCEPPQSGGTTPPSSDGNFIAATPPAAQSASTPPSQASTLATSGSRVHAPAVAGKFYPADKAELGRMVDALLADAKTVELKNLRALICPHAGYSYSGKIAAAAYKQLAGRDIRTVILLGPSHLADFSGAALPDADSMATPLGETGIAPWASKLIGAGPFVRDPECNIQASGRLFAGRPHAYEHSVETQIPFIQRVAPQAKIVPIIFGRVDPVAVAHALEPYLDDNTIIVASTDLSHYLPEKVGRPLDEKTVKAICGLETQIDPEQACGSAPVKAVTYLARQRHWKAQVLAVGNSNDVTGDKAGVGYAAIAFCQQDAKAQPAAKPLPPQYSAAHRKFLLDLARKTVTAVVNGKPEPQLKKGEAAANLMERRGCFVTLTIDGQLRGCIGNILPKEPLVDSVIHMAQAAALYDRRFEPVKPAELSKIKIEISVLTVPKPLEFGSTRELLDKLRPHVDGVVFKFEGSQSTFLPQVWEQIPSKESFLSRLSEKAGLSPFAWRSPKARFETYQVEAFHEGEAEK